MDDPAFGTHRDLRPWQQGIGTSGISHHRRARPRRRVRIGMALVAENWPAAKRARVSSYVRLGWQAGVAVAALVTPCCCDRGLRGMFVTASSPPSSR